MSVLRNVTLAPTRVLKLGRGEAERRALELLERFGLGDKAQDYPDRLSGGQQQRVAIVRALAMQPELMLFDEVTSALDPELVAEVLEVIRELAAGGMTMIFATHEMAFARDIADRVCSLAPGRFPKEDRPTRTSGRPAEGAPRLDVRPGRLAARCAALRPRARLRERRAVAATRKRRHVGAFPVREPARRRGAARGAPRRAARGPGARHRRGRTRLPFARAVRRECELEGRG